MLKLCNCNVTIPRGRDQHLIYICFVTFLLLVFVVLYSVSCLNTRKIRRLIRAPCAIPVTMGVSSVLSVGTFTVDRNRFLLIVTALLLPITFLVGSLADICISYTTDAY